MGLKTVMEKKGLSQKEVAEMYGCTIGYISHILCGDQNVGLAAAKRFARILDVPITDIIEDDHEQAGTAIS